MEHVKAAVVLRGGIPQRFCQQVHSPGEPATAHAHLPCPRGTHPDAPHPAPPARLQCVTFHDLSRFDGRQRSCRERLAKHAARRRQLRKERSASLDAGGGSGGGGAEEMDAQQLPASPQASWVRQPSIGVDERQLPASPAPPLTPAVPPMPEPAAAAAVSWTAGSANTSTAGGKQWELESGSARPLPAPAEPPPPPNSSDFDLLVAAAAQELQHGCVPAEKPQPQPDCLPDGLPDQLTTLARWHRLWQQQQVERQQQLQAQQQQQVLFQQAHQCLQL